MTERYTKPKSGDDNADVTITVFDGSSDPAEYKLLSFNKGIITFGRDKKNDIVIQSPFVSRHHGFFRYTDGAWIIVDHPDSENGLIFNGELTDSRVLDDGDSIRFENSVGSAVMVVSRGAASEWKSAELGGAAILTIGSARDCDIVLNHVSVSKLHAIIEAREGGCFIEDNNSTNGLLLNGKKVSGICRLKEKDIILITNTKLVFTKSKISYLTINNGFSLDVLDIYKVTDSGKTICNGVSLRIKSGELVAIIGPSGCGKSTLMNCMGGYSKPSRGRVVVNGMDLHGNYNALKSIIGYVPQQDIVHDNLTVSDMLGYSARLKLPEDITIAEYQDVIEDALNVVELSEHKDTLIKNLSGGQRKRASIALELLSDPNLFFLDEPASGLDPNVENKLMHTLKKMASQGKTVIFVTHSTFNLKICDKIIFMGARGNLCFCGSYDDALKFFGTDDLIGIYQMMDDDPDTWKSRYQSLTKSAGNLPAPYSGTSGDDKSSDESARISNRKWIKQVLILSGRYIHILLNDRNRLLLLLAQAPILAVLITITARTNLTDYPHKPGIQNAIILYLILSCSGFWMGISNSIQEICKERNILKREYMAGLRLEAYVLSKMIVIGIIAAVQSLLIASIFAWGIQIKGGGVFFNPFSEILLTTFLTTFAASAMGIMVSSLFNEPAKAMAVAPLLMIPQLIFSGGTISVNDSMLKPVSCATVCRWSISGYGATENFENIIKIEANREAPKQAAESAAIQWNELAAKGGATMPKDEFIDMRLRDEDYMSVHVKKAVEKGLENLDRKGVNFKSTKGNLMGNWAIMLAFIVAFAIAPVFMLRNINSEKR